MGKSFILPGTGNSITANDISKGILRITSNAKHFFPDKDAEVGITINDVKFEAHYKKRIGRSDILYLGKDNIKSLNITSKARLLITKVSRFSFLIENSSSCIVPSDTDEINIKQLLELRRKYCRLLRENRFPDPPINGNTFDMIKYFKRKVDGKHLPVGPYKNISVFEAANRIATDMVIINGIIQLVNEKKEPKDSKFTLRLGNKHVKKMGDFTINGKEGEAFNVAPSFYYGKLRSTNKKWALDKLDYILVNADVFDEFKNDNTNVKVIPVFDWDKDY